MSYYDDERYEPGHDAGPEQDCDCDECGRAVFERELTEDGCVHCNRDSAEDAAAEDAAYAASAQYVRTSWGWGEDFGADR